MSIPFLLDKKPTVVPGGSAGERSRGARSVPDRAARSKLRASDAVGSRWQAVFGCSDYLE